MVATKKIRGEPVRDRRSVEPCHLVERVPLPYPLTVAIIGLVILAEQFLEFSLLDPASRVFNLRTLLVLPILTVYILLVWRVLKARIRQTIRELWPVVQVSESEYETYVHRVITRNPRIEVALLVFTVASAFSIYVVGRSGLIPVGDPLPSNLLLAGFFLTIHTLISWLIYSFLVAGVQYAWVLGTLARRPLAINVFDPSRVLPFGRLSLFLSLTSVGLFLIPVLLLGWPREAGYLLLGLSSLTSMTALVLPVWGVHRQMDLARNKALVDISAQFRDVQSVLQRGPELKTSDLAELDTRTTSLISLRKAVLDTPTWPFRSGAAVARAVIASLSPLIFVVISELLKYGIAALLPGQ